MATTLAEAFRVLQKNAENDAALAETIRLLAEGGDDPDEPFADPGQAVRDVARLVNERRQGEPAGHDRQHGRFRVEQSPCPPCPNQAPSYQRRHGRDR